jgi:HK97 family phage major capsid protein
MTIEEIMAAMQAIIDAAAGRSLTNEEATRYEALEVDLQGAQRDQAIRSRNGAYNVVRTPAGVPQPTAPIEDHMAGIRAYLLTGRANADLQPSNAQSEGVPSEGGYLVPDLFRTELIQKLKSFGGISGVAQHYSTGNGNPIEWPTIDDTGNVGEIVEENGTFSAGADMVFGSNGLGSYSYMTGGAGSTPLRLSRELIADSAFDLQGLLTDLLATRIGRIQAAHWATGSGVKQPLGLFTGLTPVQNAANTGITYNDLVSAIHSIDPLYRTGARWLWNDKTMATIEKITDVAGNPIFRGWGANLALGLNEDTVLGFPVTIDQSVGDLTANSPTKQWGAFGNFGRGYVIRDIATPELLINPYNRMANRQVEFTAWARADGTQQDTNAYVTLSGHT